MIRVPLNKVKDSFSEYVTRASDEKILVTKHGRPAAIIIGFETEDDWFDYCLENDPKFLKRIANSRASAAKGKYKTLEQIEAEYNLPPYVPTQRTGKASVKKKR